MEHKLKPCKGINKAIGHNGCGTPTLYRTYGLCNNCLSDFIFNTDAGKIHFEKLTIKKKSDEWKKEKKVLSEKLKTLSQYEAESKKSFQHWVRLRDKDENCISCNGNDKDLWDGGHFYKAEIYSGLIFDERNVHKQCRKCNRFQNGNELNYRLGLIQRYGIEFVTQLEADAITKRNYKYTKQELIAKKLKYDILIKEIK